jgi:hypothetical protein
MSTSIASLRREVERLKAMAPSAPEADEDRQFWAAFKQFAFGILRAGGHHDALAAVQERVTSAESYTNWGARSVTGTNTALWLVSHVLWNALDDFPVAKNCWRSP